MVEAFADKFKTHAKMSPLDIAKRLSQGMRSVISGQIDGLAPRFNHTVNGHDGQRLLATFARRE